MLGIIWICNSIFSTVNLMKSNTDQIFPMKILFPNWDIRDKIQNGFRNFSIKHVKYHFNNVVSTSWSFSFLICKMRIKMYVLKCCCEDWQVSHESTKHMKELHKQYPCKTKALIRSMWPVNKGYYPRLLWKWPFVTVLSQVKQLYFPCLEIKWKQNKPQFWQISETVVRV